MNKFMDVSRCIWQKIMVCNGICFGVCEYSTIINCFKQLSKVASPVYTSSATYEGSCWSDCLKTWHCQTSSNRQARGTSILWASAPVFPLDYGLHVLRAKKEKVFKPTTLHCASSSPRAHPSQSQQPFLAISFQCSECLTLELLYLGRKWTTTHAPFSSFSSYRPTVWNRLAGQLVNFTLGLAQQEKLVLPGNYFL